MKQSIKELVHWALVKKDVDALLLGVFISMSIAKAAKMVSRAVIDPFANLITGYDEEDDRYQEVYLFGRTAKFRFHLIVNAISMLMVYMLIGFLLAKLFMKLEKVVL